MIYIGLFKWYDTSKGFGVISSLVPHKKGTAEVFCHHSCIWRTSPSHFPLVYEVRKRKKGGYEAFKVRGFDGEKEEWQFLFDNLEYNVNVYEDNQSRNVMDCAVRCISTQKSAQNFIAIYTNWVSEDDTRNISSFLKSSININMTHPEFQQFIKEQVSTFSFEERKEMFKDGKIGICNFSDDECMNIVELIERNQYITLVKSNPNLFLRIIYEIIIKNVKQFSFQYREGHSHYASQNPSQYSILRNLYDDYCLVATDEDKISLQDEVQMYILGKEDDFFNIVKEKIETRSSPKACVAEYNKLIALPACVSSYVINKFDEVSKQLVKSNSNFADNIKFMSMGFIPIDSCYIENSFQSVNEDIITLICKNETIFSSDLSLKWLLKYLEQSKEIDVVLPLYSGLTDIQSDDATDKVREAIEANLNNRCEKFMRNAPKYIDLLGEEFVWKMTWRYILETHNSSPLLDQFSIASPEYTDKLKNLLLSFTNEYSKLVDENFIKPYCGFYRRELSFVTDEYLINIIELYIDNVMDYKKSIEYAGHISSEVKSTIESYLIAKLPKEEYMILWEDETCNTLPEGYLDDYFGDDPMKYKNADKWLSNNRLTKEILCPILVSKLSKTQNSLYHRDFKTSFLIYRYFKNKNWNLEKLPISEQNISLFEWALYPYYKDYADICSVFILYPEDIQVILLKYIILCINQKKIDLTCEDLRKLNDCIPAYYDFSDDKPVMSLSVSVIIEALISYKEKSRFITDKDFYTLVYKSVANGYGHLTQIGSFFDKCTGKKKRHFPYFEDIEKYIYPVIGTDNNRWYIINFPYDEHILYCVKKITGRRYHPNLKVWFVPESSLPEIEDFASSNDFVFLHKDMKTNDIGKSFVNLTQNYDRQTLRDELYNFSELKPWNESMPQITFCEGRESQNASEEDVWWCVGHNPCNACNIRLHSENEWKDYTLFDFCNTFELNLSETNKYGHFKVGEYALFMTSINRFNKLLERLSCRECGNILYPAESNYSVNGASNFKCTNPLCKNHNLWIYLNHCYTRRCRGVIDSRDERKCPNGLVICKDCGTCCTTEMFKYRLDKLYETRAQYIPSDLIYKAEHNLGHKNNQEYFCYKCGSKMLGDINNTICPSCRTHIQYKVYN